LIIGRLVQGIGASAGPSLGKAIIRDMYEGSKLTSSLAIVTAAVALSPMLGPFMGGYIDTFWGWRVIFLALVIVAVMLGLTVNFLLPETIQQRNSRSTHIKVIFQRYKILIADKEYIFATLCAGCLTAGNFAWNSAAPFVFSDFFHVNADNYGTLSVFVGAGYLTGTISTSFLSRYLTNYRIVYSGLLLSLISSVLLFLPSIFLSSAWQMLIPMIMYTVGMGIVIPAAAACAMSRFSEIAGSAAGLFGAIQIFIGALGSAIISIFHTSSALPVVCILFAFALLAFYCGQIALFPLRAKIISKLK
jgi:predicted MFS family arabinose efflux permease